MNSVLILTQFNIYVIFFIDNYTGELTTTFIVSFVYVVV